MFEQDDMKELREKRTRMTKTYQKGEDHFALVSNPEGLPLHTLKDGLWEDYDLSIESGRVACADYDVRILEGAIGYEGTDPQGRHIRLELEGKWSEPELHENMATWVGVAPGVDFCLAFDIDRIRAVRVLHNAEAERTAVYWHERDKQAIGGLLNVGSDMKERPAELEVTEELRGETSRKITQTFTGRVLHIDEVTRNRSWSENPEYPLLLDPTSTFALGSSQGTLTYNGIVRGIYSTVDNTAGNSQPSPNVRDDTPLASVATSSSASPYGLRAFNWDTSNFGASTTYTTTYQPNSTSPTQTNYNSNVNSITTYSTKRFMNGVKMLFPVSGIPQTATITNATLTCQFQYKEVGGQARNAIKVRGFVMQGKDPDPTWTGTQFAGTGDDTGKSFYMKKWANPTDTVGGTTSIDSAINCGVISLSTAGSPGAPNTWLTDSINCTTFVANRVNNYNYETAGGHLGFNFKMDNIYSPTSLGSIPSFSAIIRKSGHANQPRLLITYTTAAAAADVPRIVFA